MVVESPSEKWQSMVESPLGKWQRGVESPSENVKTLGILWVM